MTQDPFFWLSLALAATIGAIVVSLILRPIPSEPRSSCSIVLEKHEGHWEWFAYLPGGRLVSSGRHETKEQAVDVAFRSFDNATSIRLLVRKEYQ